jgi:hypothetical protein
LVASLRRAFAQPTFKLGHGENQASSRACAQPAGADFAAFDQLVQGAGGTPDRFGGIAHPQGQRWVRSRHSSLYW